MGIRRETVEAPGYEQVVYGEDTSVGLRAFISVHSTALGPACGGIRLLPYKSKEEALEDVLRLSKGMSYKSSISGLGFGGGKSVILADPSAKTPALLQAFGRFVETFDGRYIAAKDMNITSDDLLEVKKTSEHVLGIDGVPGSSGDPSPVTAHGLFRGVEAGVEALTGKRTLRGLRIAIQGLGYVGYRYAELAREAGAELVVTDVNTVVVDKARRELGARPVGLEEIYDVDCDIFSPCARGAVLNSETIPRLKCRAVIGAANNQLATVQDAERITARGILYGPDYVVNAGGIINVFYELGGYNHDKAVAHADRIYDTMKEIFRRSKAEKTPTAMIADQMAEERIAAGKDRA